MLPKVATTILHHTTRAVAAVQGQTGYAFRNVLQSSSGGTTPVNWTGATSSGWGGAGAGAGGAKYSSSSRFYSGYTGSGRAVTQASQSTLNDSDHSQNDDNDDFQLIARSSTGPRKSRARSNSLALSSQGRNERADKMGVLKIVQLHARASHAFATEADDSLESESSRPTLVRRNSTSSASSPSSDLPPSAPPDQRSTEFLDPAAPQTVAPPLEDDFKDVAKIRKFLLPYLSKQGTGDLVVYLTQILDSDGMPADVGLYDLALEALSINRQPGVPVSMIVRIYDDMTKRGLTATARTYTSVIKALCDRDSEVQRAIRSTQERIARREVADRATGKQQNLDVESIAKLKTENNIRPAINMFQSACAARLNIPPFVYAILIRCCAVHSDEYAALRVFAHLEKRHSSQIPIAAFYHMITLYGNTRNLNGAVETFNEFKKASIENRVLVQDDDSSAIYPWNNMIGVYFKCGQPAEAISLLEQMMDSKTSTSGAPPPSAATFQAVISGFCQNDITTGLKWFRRLLQEDYIAPDPHTPLTRPPRPDLYMWRTMLKSLVEKGMVEDLNQLTEVWLENQNRDGIALKPADRLSVMEANLKDLESHPELAKTDVLARLEFVLDRIAGEAHDWTTHFGLQSTPICDRLVKLFVRCDELDKATQVFLSHLEGERTFMSVPEPGAELQKTQMHKMTSLRKLVLSTAEHLLCRDGLHVSFVGATKLVAAVHEMGLFLPIRLADAYVAVYEKAKEKGQLGDLTQQDIQHLVAAGVTLAYVKGRTEAVEGAASSSLERFESLLRDTATYVEELSTLTSNTFGGILCALLSHYAEHDLQGVFTRLGPAWRAVWNHTKVQQELGCLTKVDEQFNISQLSTDAPITPPNPDAPAYKISKALTRSIDDILNNYRDPSPLKAYNLFLTSLRTGTYPLPDCLGRLINALGRINEMKKVRHVYETAQHALSILEQEQSSPQSAAWFGVEDQMIIALAHGNDIEGAHAHRFRMLQYGQAPSADAYGALIRCVKDTTDDSANAHDLFRESQIHGVVPNVYLYNTMISKLAKARKANYALELFHKMKASGFWPSSVSYGAVIGACCRVGDYQSAELLFQEMSAQPNFKPRIPPYNTMMQLYTYTKPNRERVLHYYNALPGANIRPTAHTYKLLMDAYGTIEPNDLPAMEEVFSRLCADPEVQVQGTHWGSLIHAYGCVNKDLDKAIQVFDGIATHPSTLKARFSLPDAVAYEALINVFVTLRRTDLITPYTNRFIASGVHMTAYIANLLIKGYAVAGDLEQARDVFESLTDPLQGVAAPNNHAPHESTPTSRVNPNAPVYREPSTWEAMVRAELGNGNRAEAVVLLERMQARQFPSAVYSRISGIMLDDAVSPWPAPSFSPLDVSP